MTPTDFNNWWADCKLRWPSLDTWLCKCFADTHRQTEFLRNWRSVLLDVNLADAMEVNRLMQVGDLAWVGEYDADKERLPQHVRRLARTLRAERQPRQQPEPLPELKPSAFPAGKILRRMLELVDSGLPRDEAKAIAVKEFPVGKPTWEPRYHCHLCRDVGNVTVASPTAVQAMLAGMFDDCHHREAAVRCKCRGHIAQNPKRTICVFDTTQDFIVQDSLWPESQVEKFREWCEAKRDEFWNSKRESAFDAFNQREFVS